MNVEIDLQAYERLRRAENEVGRGLANESVILGAAILQHLVPQTETASPHLGYLPIVALPAVYHILRDAVLAYDGTPSVNAGRLAHLLRLGAIADLQDHGVSTTQAIAAVDDLLQYDLSTLRAIDLERAAPRPAL